MQIHLKQPEIEAAIRDFVAKQGISLVGREVGITFAAKRKAGGLLAEVTVSDDEFPDVPADLEPVVKEPTKPALRVIDSAHVAEKEAPATVPELPEEPSAFDVAEQAEPEPETDSSDSVEEEDEVVPAEPAQKKPTTTSLFG